MRTRTFARVEKIRSKERNLLEVLRRQATQQTLDLFPQGPHPSTPLAYNAPLGSTSVTIYAPLIVLARASERTFIVDTAAAPDPTGGFGPVTIREGNQLCELAADQAINFNGREAGTYTVYAAHHITQEHPETREPPGLFADGAGVFPEHRSFFNHGESDGTPIPREAYDPALNAETVSEWVDRVTIEASRNPSSGHAPLLSVAWNGTAITQVTVIPTQVDLRVSLQRLTTLENIVNGHVGSRGDAHGLATQATAGFMSAADKQKLDAAPANTSSALGGKANLVNGRVPLTEIATGTLDHFLVGTGAGSPVYRALRESDIPSLRASQITAGIFHLDRIPNLPAGRITSGIMPVARGGTGLANLTSGRYLQGNGMDAVSLLTPSQVRSDIDAAASDHSHALTASTITGVLPVSKGGTGLTTLASGRYLQGNSTGAVTMRTPAQVLSDIGAAASNHSHALTASTITGTLPVSKGGTGQTSLTSGSYLRGNGTSSVSLRTPSQVLGDIGALSGDGLENNGSRLRVRGGYGAARYVDIIPGEVVLNKEGSLTPWLRMQNGNSHAYIDLTGGAGYSGFLIDSVASARFGVGRHPTANTLEIAGNASKSTAGQWLANSDARIKTDVQDAVGLDAIRRLRPVTFKYKPEYLATENGKGIKDRVYHNFIAQEFAEVFPEVVEESEDVFEGNKVLQVDTHNALIAAIAAIKELDAEVQALRSQLQSNEE